MMKFVLLLFASLFFFFSSVLSQNIILEDAELECIYSFVLQKDTLYKSKPVEDDMVLRIGKNVSQFFSRHTFYNDSLWAEDTEFAMKLSIETLNSGNFTKGPYVRTTHDYIYKNYPEGKLTVMNKDMIVGFVYEEELAPQQWTILEDSLKRILDYSCGLARCDFRGRTYFAWFTADIPYDDGPWKLKGLPGLILEAYDKNKDYHYVIASIQKDNLTPVTFYNYDNEPYIKTTRHEYLKAYMEYLKGKSRKEIDLINDVIWKGKKKRYLDKGPRRVLYDFLERDYK
ncbi:GLPGLI family protein [Limibacterium fermenti]|jgi:GLPGLI family protein|uniref:GLPGLI family protein n=1 Tax=Limibacterium fermenti TaxID=3229863 RepID=UPI000E83470F|nr:GLPGLI family protein [Porphyromonadaceae bacterium]